MLLEFQVVRGGIAHQEGAGVVGEEDPVPALQAFRDDHFAAAGDDANDRGVRGRSKADIEVVRNKANCGGFRCLHIGRHRNKGGRVGREKVGGKAQRFEIWERLLEMRQLIEIGQRLFLFKKLFGVDHLKSLY